MINEGTDNVIQINDRRKVNARYKGIRIIDIIVENMYSEPFQLIMQKQGHSIEPEDIAEAKKMSKLRMVERHLDGRTTKELSGSISTLKQMAIQISQDRRAMMAIQPQGIKCETSSEKSSDSLTKSEQNGTSCLSESLGFKKRLFRLASSILPKGFFGKQNSSQEPQREL